MIRIDRKAFIIRQLADGPMTAYRLAQMLDCPEPSVRRTLHQLRADGYNITFSPVGLGEYRLGETYNPPMMVAETTNELNQGT